MPRRRDYDLGDDPDDLDDDDHPDEADMDSDDGDEVAETVRCPYCRAAIYEGAEVCPKCHSYISEEDTRVPARRPAWVVVAAVAVLVAIVVGWLVLGR